MSLSGKTLINVHVKGKLLKHREQIGIFFQSEFNRDVKDVDRSELKTCELHCNVRVYIQLIKVLSCDFWILGATE